MSNNLSASFADYWSKTMQEVFYKTNIAMKIADYNPDQNIAKQGDVLNRPYRSLLTAQLYTRGTALTIDDITDTNESLTVDKQYATAFYLDEFDSIQSVYNTADLYGEDAGVLLSNMIDAYVLGEVVNAASSVDSGNVGGTAGEGISLTTSNVVATLAAVKQALKKKNVSSTNIFGAISPEVESIMTQYIEGKDTAMGDRVGENGYVGMYYGIKFYVSNQLTSTAVLSLVTQPTANDTVTIAGQVFTFVSSIGTTVGNVLIGSDVDVTRASLATLINAPATTTATGVALTTNLRLFQNQITAANSASADTLTITAKGVGVLDVSETLTDATDTWTATKQLQRNLFGIVGKAPCLVVQRMPKMVVRPVQDKLGNNYLNGVLFGTKTFTDQGKQMVDVKVRCDTYNA